MGMFAAGYIQWFHVVPRLPGRRKIVALNLSTAETPVSQNTLAPSTSPSAKISPAKVTTADADTRTPVLQNANVSQLTIQTTHARASQTSGIHQPAFHATDTYVPPVPKFDEHGRTPVERAFADALSG
jgi:hypothetical protein